MGARADRNSTTVAQALRAKRQMVETGLKVAERYRQALKERAGEAHMPYIDGWEILDAWQLNEHEVSSMRHVEILRELRNACRAGFSRVNRMITPEEQAAWWKANRRAVKVWLYSNDAGEMIGFGMLRKIGPGDPKADRAIAMWYTTVGVHPDHGGKGYGGAITRLLVRQDDVIDDAMLGIARRDNVAACKLHCEADWVVLEGTPTLMRFRKRQPSARWRERE